MALLATQDRVGDTTRKFWNPGLWGARRSRTVGIPMRLIRDSHRDAMDVVCPHRTDEVTPEGTEIS